MELRVTATSRDGAGVARAPDGRVIFVEGALPGERVVAEITRVDRRWSRARVVRVLDAAPDRVPVPCEHQAEGCGGCDMLHVAEGAQLRMKSSIVVDQLTRVGVDAPCPELRSLDDDGGRTTVRAAVLDGRAGYRKRSSHDVVVPEVCDAIDPLAHELLIDGRYPGVDEVTIRVGARTGDRLVVVSPGVGSEVGRVSVPADVDVVGVDELAAGRRAWIHEEAAGRRWRISARSFFQKRPAGADALVDEVGEMVDELGGDGDLVDAFAGVGLFAGTVAGERRTVAIERNRDSVADARVNLADGSAKVLRLAVERWRPSPAGVVVADPAREGVGVEATAALLRAEPSLFVLVSCDPSSFAADARRLADAGYELRRWTVVDLFPLTSHVETVAAFTPTS